ncbi:hypothetical protein BDZ88DRAFT_428311 [Geranomyces variabilis]|nr:hypothetical protein BDZ88DRAFT_428311 [Geranomyces variabilis]
MLSPPPSSAASVADATAAVAADDPDRNADFERTLRRLRVAAAKATAIIKAKSKSAAQAVKTPESPNSLHDAQSVMSVSAHTQTSEPTTPTQPAADSAARSCVHIPHRLNPQLCQRPVGCGTTYLAASDSEAHKSAASQPERQPRTRRRTKLRAKPPPPLFKRHLYIPQPPRYPTAAPTPSPTLSNVTSILQARRPRKPRNRPRRTGSGIAKQNPDAMVGVLEHALKALSADAALVRMNAGLERLATEMTRLGAAPQPLVWDDIVERRVLRDATPVS